MSSNREMCRPEHIFCIISMKILAVWDMATFFLEACLASQAAHFRSQKFLKHVPVTFGVYSQCLMLFILKDVRSDDGG